MTDRLDAAIVDAFTTDPTTGVPAGAVPDATGLAADQMVAIARELGASETAFVREPGDWSGDGDSDGDGDGDGDGEGEREKEDGVTDYALRSFAPETELDRPGHAAVAAFALLAERGDATAGTYAVGTAAGPVDVEIADDGTVWVTRPPPEFRTVDVSMADAAAALGLDASALSAVGEDLPITRVSTGSAVLVVPVGYFEALSSATPDEAAVGTLCERTDAEALYAFTFDTLGVDATAHGRLFPSAGRSEEPETGAASVGVGAYLRRHDAIDAPDPLVFEGGHFLDRPGRVRVRTADGSGTPAVGGRAVTVLDGDLTVPEPDDEDIVTA